MPVYEFEHRRTGARVERWAAYDEIGALTRRMRRRGYQRVYSVGSAPVMGLTFDEAMEVTGNRMLMAYEGRGEMVGRPDDYDASKERTPRQKAVAERQKRALLKGARNR